MTTVLVIDDAPMLLEEMSELLSFEGYDVLQASNGTVGLQLAREHRPDIILCDMLMPGIDGYEVLRIVRQEADLAHTSFIFSTAMAGEADRQRGLELGANGYLTKPFAAEDLFAIVAAQVGKIGH